MADGEIFIDYYNVLNVGPNCAPKTLEAAYRRLAKQHHPDQTDSSDSTKFTEVTTAYRILRDPQKRKEYDASYAQNVGRNFGPSQRDGVDLSENAALTDADEHAQILMALYKRRRENPQNPGIVGTILQDMLNCSYEHFEFHKWYLREKGFIAVTEQGTLAITIQGVDHVISMSRTTRAEKLLIAASTDRS